MSNDEGMTKLESRMIKTARRRAHSSFVIRHSAIAAFFALGFSLEGQPPPSAKNILASVRMIESQQQIDLQGQLRQNDVVVPFRLVQNGPLIRYSFTNPEEVLQLRLGENSSRLDLVSDAGTEKFAPSKLNQRIRGTSVTYEDLAFKFLCVAVDRQGERRSNADGRLRLERATRETLRSRFRAKDRGSLVSETNACRRISARRESRAGEDVSGNQKVGTPRCGVRLKC